VSHDDALAGAICDAEAAIGAPFYDFAGTVYGRVYGAGGLQNSVGILIKFNCTVEGLTVITRKFGAN